MMPNWLRGLILRWRIWRIAQDVRTYGFVTCQGCGNCVRLVNGRCELCGKPVDKAHENSGSVAHGAQAPGARG